jgi:hypothetical protein
MRCEKINHDIEASGYSPLSMTANKLEILCKYNVRTAKASPKKKLTEVKVTSHSMMPWRVKSSSD